MAPAASTPDSQLLQLADYLAGQFDNRQQSLADPVWFLHLRVWNRPLPASVFPEGQGFFIEQVNVATGQPPYRQRVLHLTQGAEGLLGQYYGLQDPLKFCGGATQPRLLEGMSQVDLVDLPCCCLTIEFDPTTAQFKGRLPADTLCTITYDGKTSYISLGFDIAPQATGPNPALELVVYDRGVDADTGATTWGPRMGPFRLTKQIAFGVDSSFV
jgi:hypothetical protein